MKAVAAGPSSNNGDSAASDSRVVSIGGVEDGGGSEQHQQKQLDAGAKFVLKSEGSWMHCGYHLSSSTVGPPLLSLPFALALLGWGAGMACLTVCGVVTFYTYNLLSLVLEQQAQLGRRQLRYRDIADDILGKGWGRYFIGPLQFLVCYGAVVGAILLGGATMKSIYLIAKPDGTMKLYEFIVIFGVFMLILAQLPSFHSLRHINLAALLICLVYTTCAIGGSIYAGHSVQAPTKDYSLPAATQAGRVFGAFNGIAVIATTYGNGIIPEIQATIAPPVKGKMFKGLLLCYAVVLVTFFGAAVSGYWAFGNQSAAIVLMNFVATNGELLVPEWLIVLPNTLVVLQIAIAGVVYLQPTNDVLEIFLSDSTKGQYSARNVVPRLLSRSLGVAIATTLAAMLPFFGDLNALMGAFGFMPLDFVLPPLFYIAAFKPRGLLLWANVMLMVVFSAVAVVGCISALRQIILDANTYQLFSNQ